MGELPPPLLSVREAEESTGPTSVMSAPDDGPGPYPFVWSSMDLPGMDPDEDYD